MKANPLDPASSKTQIATTVGTYRKAVPILRSVVLDYGAGLGLGADALRAAGLEVRTYEPFPERWKSPVPVTYRDASMIPSGTFGSIICLNVLNVVPERDRLKILSDFRRVLAPGGVVVINARSVSDVSKASVKKPGPEPDSWIIGTGSEARFQRGFTSSGLASWLRRHGWSPIPVPGLAGIAFVMKPASKEVRSNPSLPPGGPEAEFRRRVRELRESAVRMRAGFPRTADGDVDVRKLNRKQLADAFAHDQAVRDLVDELKRWAVPASGVTYSKPAPSVDMTMRGVPWAVDLYRELTASQEPKRPLLPNPMNPTLRRKLATVLEKDDRVLDYDRATGEELYRLYDVVYTDQPLNHESLTEIEGLLDDKGVLVILSGEMPEGLGDHFKRAVRHQGMILVQHPKNPEEARIKAEEERRGS